ncbi:MAG: polymerase subunit delta [Acidobacteriota bacterium]|jgi:DNA polymerase-3 subunit delta'|nr:polymerase subunit delta [Acidobacteriota bacterium]
MFDHLAGNQRVKDILCRMLATGRVPGALLFAGEDGVGKKLFALELAKALNCLAPVGIEACDKCSSCLRISQSKFPDYTDADDNKKRLIRSDHPDVALARPYNRILRIGPMRELEQEANFRPFEGKARIFIIEDAARLNEASSNALLKTLEEPPRTSHLILITSRPASLLPTIRSRCQMIRFAPLAPAEIEAHLLKGKQASPKDARLLSRVARGSIGRALSTDLETYRLHREAMLDVLGALALTNDRARLLRASEEMNDAKHKDEYEMRLDLLATLIHDVWTLSLGAPDEQVANEDLRAQLSKIVSRIESRRAARWLSQIETHRRGLEVNINRKVSTDSLFLSMAES